MTFIEIVRSVGKQKIFFTQHAVNMMNAPERMVTPAEVYEVIARGELVEDYPDNGRGHSCLIGAVTSTGRNIYVVCAPKESHLVIITVYPKTKTLRR